MLEREGGIGKLFCFVTDNDVSLLAGDFEVQAWATDLVETDPLLGCGIKVSMFSLFIASNSKVCLFILDSSISSKLFFLEVQ